MKKVKFNKKILIIAIFSLLPLLFGSEAKALRPGALVYRTSGSGIMYGYSSRELLGIKKGILQHIYPGHVGIYVGSEDGVHYIVEALAGGIVKTRAEHFVNEAAGEKLVGAKMPKAADFSTRQKAVKIAKALAEKNFGYDFSFQKQKGPNSGDWTCVGLVEKIYESAGMLNPSNLNSLVYDSDNYKIDITPDGFDNISFINSEGDCFSTKREFSKIAARKNLILPPPETIGYNAGRLYKGERYFFLPYTQFLQNTLKDEKIGINLKSSFKGSDVRGKTPTLSLMLRWTLVNNPLSSIKSIADSAIEKVRSITKKIFGNNNDSLTLDDFDLLENDPIKDNSDTETYRPIVSQVHENDNKPGSPSNDHEIMLRLDNDDYHPSPPTDSKIVKSENNTRTSLSSKTPSNSEPPKSNIVIRSSDDSSQPKPEYVANNQSSLVNINKQDEPRGSSISVKKEPDKPSAGSLKLANSKIKIGTKPEEANSPGEQSNANIPSGTPSAYISKIYATGMNDFIELYNPNDFDFDLAEAGFRIEKTKTADNPSIVMRIGHETDGIYPGGTIIRAKSYYLMVRDGASPYFLALADAIGKRREFGWTGNGYTLYLGKGPISSSDDPDILDALGYGSATYFRGSGPAAQIADNYYLNRRAFNNDNSSDFELLPSSDPAISWDDYIDPGEGDAGEGEGGPEESNDDNDDETPDDAESPGDETGADGNGGDGDESNQNHDFSPFVFPGTIEASDISHLWHFNECHGELDYTVGIFDCALSVSYNAPEFEKILDPEVDLNKFSLAFYYRDHSLSKNNSPRIRLRLTNESDKHVEILLQKKMLQIEGLPNTEWRYYDMPVFSDKDYNWRHFALVVDKEAGYWAAYINGREVCRHEFIKSLPNNFNHLLINDDTGRASIDELVFFSEALSESDINTIIDAAAPFAPYPKRAAQKYPALAYYWNFNEGHHQVNEGGGNEASDMVEGLVLNLPDNAWIWRDTDNTGIANRWGKDLSVKFSRALSGPDMSLAFWWRSDLYPNDGRSQIGLYHNDRPQFVLTPSYYRRNYWYGNKSGLFSEGENTDFAKDENWHHFVMTYDSYRYQLKLYVNGQEKKTLEKIWLKNDELPNRLVIKNELNRVEIDDLAIFEGALSPVQAAQLYQGSLIDNSWQ